MSGALASVALLCGILLIATGIVLAFVTGFDLLFLIGAAVMIGLGTVLILKFKSHADTGSADSGIPNSQRSFQKPDTEASSKRTKLNDKL